jgi:NAD(P)-dependent dehydrogenase (short-subunit alcohol dehydrogenase family)
MNIENAVILITGANRGLGREFAKQALARGAKRVYAAARDSASVDVPGVVALELDVTRQHDAAAAATNLADVTIVINNAGIARLGAFVTADAQDILRA